MNFDADDLIELVAGMADMDFATMPGPMFLGALRRELIENEFTAENVEAIVVRIGIELPPGSLDQRQVDALAAQYCRIICKLRAALIAQGFSSPDLALIEMARSLTLKMS